MTFNNRTASMLLPLLLVCTVAGCNQQSNDRARQDTAAGR